MSITLLEKAMIVTSEKEAEGSVVIKDGIIEDIIYSDSEDYGYRTDGYRRSADDVINIEGRYLMAGGIDAHVHFREPGLTHKADMQSESEAALAGGVTSFMDMPNTIPQTVSAKELKMKIEAAQGRVRGKISFHIGATGDNVGQICRLVKEGDAETGIRPEDIAGVKVFMGSSTGNMLVEDKDTLERLFSIHEKPVLVHCEDEKTIRENTAAAIEKYGDNIPFSEHEHIRSRKACIKSSIKALELAMKHQTKLVLCHISTKEEIEMVRAAKSINPDIMAETSCNYLWFCNEDYERMGSRLKCNPSVKTLQDREALRRALAEGLIDTIGSDHAPHLLTEKDAPYTKAPSGLPTIQQSLPVLITIAMEEGIPFTRIASVFSEKAADIYHLNRGKVKRGYEADLVVFDCSKEHIITNEEQKSKCGWTPYEGALLKCSIEYVFINGRIINN
ncbi:MAG: dihydroorotase [Bacteroidales bacterium]|nr:dihydroorotase [Bacteroidales bacterium]